MPRMISFSMTTPQFIDGTKDVTRRIGWLRLKEGDILMAVEKAMGLGKGGTVKRLCLIQAIDVRRESLRRMVDDRPYGMEECRREGFPQMTTADFVWFFCEGHKGCTPETIVTRIAFRKVAANG
jgi:hypothetical protein